MDLSPSGQGQPAYTAISWLAWPAQSPWLQKRAGTGPSKDKVLALKVQKGPWGEEQAGPGPDMGTRVPRRETVGDLSSQTRPRGQV